MLTGHRKVIRARSTDECKTLEFAGFAGLMQLGRVVVLSRAFELARGTAYESHARANVKRIDEGAEGILLQEQSPDKALRANSMICGGP